MSEKIENRLKIIKIISAVVALGQLALSQVHIGVITKVFERTTGIYLFIFTLFCLVGLFMATRLNSPQDVIKHLIINALAIAAAMFYLQLLGRDLQAEEFVTFELISKSVILMGTFTICLVVDSILLLTVYKEV